MHLLIEQLITRAVGLGNGSRVEYGEEMSEVN